MQSPSRFRIIGKGTCGTVFDSDTLPARAYKKGPTEGLWTDIILTNKAYNASQATRQSLQRLFPTFSIPRVALCHHFLLPNDKFWGSHLQRFPRSHRSRQALFEVDRILPLPEDMRDGLIERYFSPDKQDSAKADPENGDCLARVYLGRRESEEEQDRAYDTLRNFPLYLNMLEEMNYDVVGLAEEMGIGLAVLHFEAGVDAMDTKFVLGARADDERPSAFPDVDAPPQKSSKKPAASGAGVVQMWMLDFDKARCVDITDYQQVQVLAVSFLGNDPYFPTPDEPQLWEPFSGAYNKAGDKILASKGLTENEEIIVRGGPRLVLDSVKSRWEQMKVWEAERDIVFGD